MPKYNNDMVAHVWAQGNGESGESSNGNFWFQGNAIYSYRTIMGVLFTPPKRGAGLMAFVNNDSYSVTTSKHQNYIGRAISHRESMAVSLSLLESLHDANRLAHTRDGGKVSAATIRKECESIVSAAWDSLESALRARTKTYLHFRDAAAHVESAQQLADLFRVSYTVPKPLRESIAAPGIEYLNAVKTRRDSSWGSDSYKAAGDIIDSVDLADYKPVWKVAIDKRKAIETRALRKEQRRRAIEARAREVIQERETMRRALVSTRAGKGKPYAESNETLRGSESAYGRYPLRLSIDSDTVFGNSYAESGLSLFKAYKDSVLFMRLARMDRLAPSLRKAFESRALAAESEWIAPALAHARRAAKSRLRQAIARVRDLVHDAGYSGRYNRYDANGFGYTRDLITALENLLQPRKIDTLGAKHANYTHDSYYIGDRGGVVQLPKFMRDKVTARLESLRTIYRDAKAESERFAREQAKEQFEAWRRGESVSIPAAYRETPSGGVYMRRIERNGESLLETSGGAQVPFAHAVRVFKVLKHMRATGKSWQRNGKTLRVGHFSVDRIDFSGGFVAGCHAFHWPEIEAIAIETGVFEVEPDDSAIVSKESA